VPIVVSDTSPIRALANLDLLSLLGLLFDQVLIPPAVSDELDRAGVKLNAPSGQLPAWMVVRPPSDVVRVAELRRELDLGESEAISLAIEIGSTEILIDEHDGRQVARRLGLEPVGVIGLLVRGKGRGHVPAVLPLLDRLQNELNFFISSDLRTEAQRLAGE
jgi:uncharacterized protein